MPRAKAAELLVNVRVRAKLHVPLILIDVYRTISHTLGYHHADEALSGVHPRLSLGVPATDVTDDIGVSNEGEFASGKGGCSQGDSRCSTLRAKDPRVSDLGECRRIYSSRLYYLNLECFRLHIVISPSLLAEVQPLISGEELYTHVCVSPQAQLCNATRFNLVSLEQQIAGPGDVASRSPLDHASPIPGVSATMLRYSSFETTP